MAAAANNNDNRNMNVTNEEDYGDDEEMYDDNFNVEDLNEEDNSFYPNDDMNNNEKARARELHASQEPLSVDPQLIGDLRELKRSLYNAVVFGPPVGSEEAQDLANLETYESLLLELNNLLHDIFEEQVQPTAQHFARFPEALREPARLYSLKVVEFKNTNALPYLNDVLKDLFDRNLKEHPY